MAMSLEDEDDDDYQDAMCNGCETENIQRRYKCLRCFDYDLCGRCHDNPNSRFADPHKNDHPMQLVLTAAEKEIYLKKDDGTVEEFDSFTCPYCCQLGFTKAGFYEHIAIEHRNNRLEVICPICAADYVPCDLHTDLCTHVAEEHIMSMAEWNSSRRPRLSEPAQPRLQPNGRGAYITMGGLGRGLRIYQEPPGMNPYQARFRNMPQPEASTSFAQGADIVAGDLLRHLTVSEPSDDVLDAHLRRLRARIDQMYLDGPESLVTAAEYSSRASDNATDTSVTASMYSSAESSVDDVPALESVSAFNLAPATDVAFTAMWNDERALLPSALRQRVTEEDKERMERERANRSLFLQDLCFSSFLDMTKPETAAASEQPQSQEPKQPMLAKKSVPSTTNRKAKKSIVRAHKTKATDTASTNGSTTVAAGAGEPCEVVNATTASNKEENGTPKTTQESVVNGGQGVMVLDGGGGGDAGADGAQQNGAANGSQV